MSAFFYGIYQYFTSRRYLLIIGIIAVFAFCGISLYNANLEEDITKILPQNEEIRKFNEGFLNSELSSRVIIHLMIDDAKHADDMKSYCQEIVDSLTLGAQSDLIKSVTYKIDPSSFQRISQNIGGFLPFLLDDADYVELEKRIQSDSIKNRVDGAYKALISPASFAFKKMIQKDPLGMMNFVIDDLTNLQIDDNFELDGGYLLTKDKKHLLFFISPSTVTQESTQNKTLIDHIVSTGENLNPKYESVKFEYFGGSAIGVANASRIKKDVTFTVSIALTFLLLLISFFYRDIKIFFYILIPVLVGAAFALGMMGMLKPSLSIIAIGIGSVLIGIGIDFSIHLFTHHREHGSVKKVLSDVSTPIILSALTTSTAFLCLYFVRSEALHDLGLFAALSVFSAAVFTLIILPHLFKDGNGVKQTTFLDNFVKYPFERNKFLVLGLLVLTVFCSFFASGVKFEKNLNNINYMPPNLLEAEKNINEISDATKRGIYVISFGKNLDQALQTNADFLPTLQQLKDEGKIESFTSPNQLLLSKADQQRKIKKWNQFWTAEKVKSVKGDIIKHTTALKFKPEAFQPFYDIIEADYNPIDAQEMDKAMDGILSDYYSVQNDQATSNTLIRLEADQKQYVHNALKGNKNVSIIDKEHLITQFVDTLKEDFNKLVLISLLVVFLILHLVYGRPELAWIAAAPIGISWLITLGMMNLLDIKFNIVNIIITSFIFGLGIDYSIFVMRGLLQSYRTGEENLESYKKSIIISASTTLIGIGVLIFAQHPALKSIAAISIIGITSVILATFIIQPLFFRFLTEKDGKRREWPLTFTNMGKTLWVYFALFIGSLSMAILALLLRILFFIPLESRKTFFHKALHFFWKSYIKVSFLNRVTYHNDSGEKFTKPALVIANHKSLIDTPLFLQLTPKMLIITNDWVSKSPLFKSVCKMADYYSITDGAEEILEKLKDRVEHGYSISIFPEGTRSPSEKTLRFRKGAFYLADQLKLDIVPMYIHGTNPFLAKKHFWGRASEITVKIEDRIPYSEIEAKGGYSAFTKHIGRSFRNNYDNWRKEVEDVDYLRDAVIHSYLYKGPVEEWYTKVKTKLEYNYRVFDELLPENCDITDLGCGYGYMTYFLGLSHPDRKFTSVDYDEQKIAIANHIAIKQENMEFVHADITDHTLAPSDVFIISDVIHYLTKDQQYDLLDRCHSHLNKGGMIILRDGDTDLKERHKGTKLTEVISTNIGFNKTKNKLNYISGSELKEWVNLKKLSIDEIDHTKFTSNVIFVIRKKSETI